jgi:GMP synthase-like glutamine amidotransferase
MRVSILQHAPFEGPGRIGAWLESRALGARVHALYEQAALPGLDDFDLLIVLGGPMNLEDEDQYPWLGTEKLLIRAALETEKRLLGIGFGAQLIADALGARVRDAGQAEVGWWPVEKYPQAHRSPLGRMLPQRLLALHWDERNFELPAGAIPLYGSAACACQGFIWKERAIALQYHLESTPDSIEALLGACAEDLKGRGAVQDASAIRQGLSLCSTLKISLFRLLDYLSGPHAALR